ncbi:hypothetical protein [Massilia sp. DWR3-1-1]|uniref:hypothetical protein n=1 Tax=Massilia sp. DWR3-1-1 TaxID=2804559 RepID=UPI003CE7255D
MMALLSQLFSRKPKYQSLVAERAVAVIDKVIYDVGVDALVGGTFVLDKKFRLRFVGAPTPVGPNVHAAVKVGEIAEAQLFRALGYDAPIESTILKAHGATLAQAVVRELGSRSPAFGALPASRQA